MATVMKIGTAHCLAFLLLVCCAGNSSKSARMRCRIILSPMLSHISQGEEISYKVSFSPRDSVPAQVQLLVDGELLGEALEGKVQSQLLSVGVHALTVVAKNRAGQEIRRWRKNFTITPQSPPKKLSWRLVKTYPRSPKHYTQGLEYAHGKLWESTGIKGASSLYSYEDFRASQPMFSLTKDFFGEGITWVGDKLYRLTWKSRQGFVYQKEGEKLTPKKRFIIPRKEGWGLTHIGANLVMSDGSEYLFFVDTATFQVVRSLPVLTQRKGVHLLNELEYHREKIFANIYTTDIVILINPQTGAVESLLDFSDLHKEPSIANAKNLDVLNGIAILPSGNLLITGKQWPALFEISITSNW